MSAIYVLAGVNGAGKSSIGGAAIRAFGGDWYNPDEFARTLMARNPALGQRDANGIAWSNAVTLLGHAIEKRLDFAMETTLGGSTISRLLAKAAADGIAIRIWYVGLTTAEQHIARVRARVAKGGHDIPEADIRRRFKHSRINLIDLLPALAALRVFDNSAEADPDAGLAPAPKLVLSVEHQRILAPKDLWRSPEWAKPIVAAALRPAAN